MRRCPADRKLEQKERAVELSYIGLGNMGGALARLRKHKMQVFKPPLRNRLRAPGTIEDLR